MSVQVGEMSCRGNILLTGWVGCTNVTDRQTTDGIAIAYSERNVVDVR